MGHIHTHRHHEISVFQSLVEDVASRIEERLGQVLGAASPGSNGSRAPRKSEGHVAHDVASRISSHRIDGETIPATAPQDLRTTHGDAVDSLWSCAKLAAELLGARAAGNAEKANQILDELKFGTCDPEWVEAILHYLEFFGPSGKRRDIPYIRHESLDDFVLETLPADAKIALLGDWGTGTEEAIALLESLKEHQPDVVIHLGDIYYSGTARETHEFFLDILNQVFGRETHPIPVYTLTGNHDMYSGGQGYYALLPQLNPEPLFRAEQTQPASYFCLRSVDQAWQILAMDTGLHDHDPFTAGTRVTYLEPSEVEWHVDKVKRFSAEGGRTVLLSHHQLFSALETIGEISGKPKGQEAANPNLLDTFHRLQEAGAHDHSIAAWFWGHEHDLDVYRPYLGLEKGRCIGHAAIPMLVAREPYAGVPELPDPPELVDDPGNPGKPLELATVDEVYAHGFVILQLDDRERTATASYYQETDYSRPMYEERL